MATRDGIGLFDDRNDLVIRTFCFPSYYDPCGCVVFLHRALSHSARKKRGTHLRLSRFQAKGKPLEVD